jgi:octaprenyl-diphosphate synthase
MARCTAAERELIRGAIRHGEVERLAEVVQIVRRTGAVDATREAARREAEVAARCLRALPASPEREALLNYATSVVERSS